MLEIDQANESVDRLPVRWRCHVASDSGINPELKIHNSLKFDIFTP